VVYGCSSRVGQERENPCITRAREGKPLHYQGSLYSAVEEVCGIWLLQPCRAREGKPLHYQGSLYSAVCVVDSLALATQTYMKSSLAPALLLIPLQGRLLPASLAKSPLFLLIQLLVRLAHGKLVRRKNFSRHELL
jgi:hypothetical protein